MKLEFYSGSEHISRQESAHANAAKTLQLPQAFFFCKKLAQLVKPKLYSGHALSSRPDIAHVNCV